MKFLIVLCVVLEATFASPIEPGYGVPLAPVISPIQTVTLPEGPALLTAPTTIRVVAQHAPAHFVHQLPLTSTQFVHHSAPQFIQTVAGPLAPQAPVQVAAPLAFAAPVPALPVVGPTAVQHHAQDEFGAFNYGYQDINSAKQEVHTADGVTRGSYSYVDANGLLQRVDYIADPINGFRVAGTNIPVGPNAILPAGPAQVQDTAEVAAAKAEFAIAFAEAEAQASVTDAPEQ